jgi:two-component system, LytTR family, response regulator
MTDNKIRVVIVDDDKDFAESLHNHLSAYSDIEICGMAFHYKKAKSLIREEKPELLFLDIEMPGKNGFELLQELRSEINFHFHVIFYTAFDQYILKALRESAFDYLIKPVKSNELGELMERYRNQKNETNKTTQVITGFTFPPEITSLPTNTGLRFIDKNNIVLFLCKNDGFFSKPYWEVILNNRESIKLRPGTTAKDITRFLNSNRFIQISQSAIVNAIYLNIIEYKTRQCILVPPFNDISLTVSRTHLTDLKDQCDLL